MYITNNAEYKMHGNQERGVLEIGADKYKVIADLPGRGPGKGFGVYAEKLDAEGVGTGGYFIIKEDKLSTCLAESLMTLPNNGKDVFSTSAIQASLGVLKKTGSSTPILVTVQPKFVAQEGQQVKGLDQFILGDKRNPNTLWSEESSNQQKIADCISAMSDPVKKQFAKAIYLSQLNGDESLHIGQFMVTVGKDSKISEIVRVDFGALGRWADKRKTDKDFKLFNTSQAYHKSWFSQFGNDYVSYLVKDPIVQTELVRLWIDTNVDEYLKGIQQRFKEQLDKFPANDPVMLKTALQDFHNDVLNTGGDKIDAKVVVTQLMAQVKVKLLLTSSVRCEQMVKEANIILREIAQSKRIKEVIDESLPQFCSKPEFDALHAISNLLGTGDNIISELANLSTLEQLEAYIARIEKEASDPKYARVLQILYPLKEELNPTKTNPVEQYKVRLTETIQELGVKGENETSVEESASATSTPTGRTSPGKNF